MVNPYSSYVLSFSIALLAYLLGWSELYPPLHGSLLTFLVLSIAFHLALSRYWKSTVTFSFPSVDSFFNPVAVTIFIYGLWTADFIYEGGIPLVKILLNQPYNYRLFGVPSLHVFTVTFGSFFTVFLFSLFISSGKRASLYLYLINLFAALLIYNRGMLIFNIVASAFIYFFSSPHFSWRRVSFLALGFLSLIYFFGVMGSLRVSFEAKQKYDPNIFLKIGKASTTFRESWIPKEFFWAYIYLSSPVANLQQNINTFQVPTFSLSRMVQYVNNEMLFDFISKRVNRIFGVERERENTIPERPFNVSTVYSRSFSYLGWIGMYMMCAFVLILPLIYLKILPINRYYLTGIALINTMYLFLFFDNTIRFTGLGFQLVYPFVLPLVEKTTVWFQKKTAL